MAKRLYTLIYIVLFAAGLASAQVDWDNYDNVLAALRDGSLHVPEADNYKIVIGPSEFPLEAVANGKAWVHYLIKWTLSPQQIGTGFILRDTLDPSLDGASVTMLASSNPYQIQKMGSQIYSWSVSDFIENAAVHEGHVYFKVQVKPCSKPGVIRNTAFIELQNGSTLQTTVAAISILKVADSPEIQEQSIRVWPNPAQGQFVLDAPPHVKIEVLDAFGKFLNTTCAQGQCTITDAYTTGIHHVRVTDLRTNRVSVTRLLID